MNKYHENSGRGKTDIWLTPLEIVSSLGIFDLDPCGESFHKTAVTVYTDKGLEKEWFGRVWLNPPYSQVELWLDKLVSHGRGIALVAARTDTKWAQKIIPKADSVFFPKGRIRFLTHELIQKQAPTFPNMFLSFGEVPEWQKFLKGISFVLNEKAREAERGED